MEHSSRWKPGQSGNPAGRPPGTGVIGKLRQSIEEHVPEIVGRLVEQAKGGDVAAARLLLERVMPPIKPTDQTIQIGPLGGSLTDQGRAVIAAAADGSLTTSQAAQLLSGLGDLAKLTQTDELVARIEALEGRSGTAGK